MRIGYARVSRDDQNPQYQHDALGAAGCARIFEDRISGAEFSRAGLDQALAALESGGVLVVWKLDRLQVARSLGVDPSTLRRLLMKG